MHAYLRILLWVVLPALHFRFWFQVSRQHSADVSENNKEYLLDVSKVGVVGDFEDKFLMKLDVISDFLVDIITNSHDEGDHLNGVSKLRKRKCKPVGNSFESIHSYISRRALVDISEEAVGEELVGEEEGGEGVGEEAVGGEEEAEVVTELEAPLPESLLVPLDKDDRPEEIDDYYDSGTNVDLGQGNGGLSTEKAGGGGGESPGHDHDDYYGSGVEHITKRQNHQQQHHRMTGEEGEDGDTSGVVGGGGEDGTKEDDYYSGGVEVEHLIKKKAEMDKKETKDKEEREKKEKPKKDKQKKGKQKKEDLNGDDYYGGLLKQKAKNKTIINTDIYSFDTIDSTSGYSSLQSQGVGCPEPAEEIDLKTGCPKLSKLKPSIYLVPAEVFDRARMDKLAEVPYMKKKNTVVAKRDASERCEKFVSDTSGTIIGKFCFAVVRVKDTNASMNLIRIARNIDEAGNDLDTIDIVKKVQKALLPLKQNEHNEGTKRPTGFFRSPPRQAGRNRLMQKMQPFLTEFEGSDGIEAHLATLLRVNNIKRGDDLIAMVLNEGELDLYLNFACSCKFHNISMRNVLVFSGNAEAVPVVESTGAMAIYHKGFASVSRHASTDYLDRVFVDMMWYKAFSIFLVLRSGINVLFQDLDLVWFKEPFQYFKDYLNATYEKSVMSQVYTEAFFSDDGQRSHRYTPFFANSGFYYLISGPRSINFAWSIMAGFDTVQVGGSHQNVFTMKLVEGLGIGYPQAKLLPLNDFPTGMLFHHSKKYMANLLEKKVTPYHFHMCWTGGKADKLRYFKETKMWYVHDTCQLSSIIYDEKQTNMYTKLVEVIQAVEKSPHRTNYHAEMFQDSIVKSSFKVREFLWKGFSSSCCSMMPGAI